MNGAAARLPGEVVMESSSPMQQLGYFSTGTSGQPPSIMGLKTLPAGRTDVSIEGGRLKIPMLSSWEPASSQPICVPQSNLGQSFNLKTQCHQQGPLFNPVEDFTALSEKLHDQAVGSRALFPCRIADVYDLERWNTNWPGDGSVSISDRGRGKHRSNLLPMDLTKHSASSTTNTPFSPTKTLGHTHDHILAERKRREKLTQRFIALSAIIPDLKRTDKASILGDTIKYVKRLQEKTKLLEEQMQKESVSSKVHATGEKIFAGSSSTRVTGVGEAVGSSDTPEIEVRMVDDKVLIRVHCEKRKGLLLKSVGELEKLKLVVLNANVLSFTERTFDLTFNTQVEEGSKLTADHIIEALREVFSATN